MGGWGRLGTSSLSILASIPLLSGTVSANPIASPFDYTIEIAYVNYPINGLILLALYLLITPNGPNFVQMRPIKQTVLFLSVVGTISFTGAIVDSMAYTTMSLPVFLFACTIIGFIVAIVSVRYLRMNLEDGVKVGIVFLFVNLMMWSAEASDLFHNATWEYPGTISVMYILLIVVVSFVIVIKRRKPSPSEDYRLDTWSSLPSDHQIDDNKPQWSSDTDVLVLEAFTVALITFLIVYFSYGFFLE